MSLSVEQAFNRLSLGSNTMVASMEGAIPNCLLMYDSGTFKHMAGKGSRHMMISIRDLPRSYPVDSASGVMWIKQECDLYFGDTITKDCLVNPTDMETTLLSEGLLALMDYWELQLTWQGKEVIDAEGKHHWAYRKGALFYVPAELLPSKHNLADAMDMEIDRIEEHYQMVLEQEASDRRRIIAYVDPHELDEELEYIQAHYDMLKLEREVAENEAKVAAAVTRASTANTRALELADEVKCEGHMHKPTKPG